MPIDSLRRVVLTGPESSGKSTLAESLANHFSAVLVPEFARTWIRDKRARTGENCVLDDVPAIARGQEAAENQAAAALKGPGFLICDTDVLTIRIWSECFFGAVPSELDTRLSETHSGRSQDLYLLTDIDVPWVADGVRDRPGNRESQMALFRSRLGEFGCRSVVISGDLEARRQRAIEAIERWRVE
jgi:HTH-type transcriptional regulator, transcriptional repressor of NAD biosynthesis genes